MQCLEHPASLRRREQQRRRSVPRDPRRIPAMVVPQPRHQQSRRGVQLLPVDAVQRRLLRAKPKVRSCVRGVAAAPEGPRGQGGRRAAGREGRGGGRARGRPLRVVQRLPVLLPHPPSEAHRRPRSPRGAPRARRRLRVLGRVDAVAVAGAGGSERCSPWQGARAWPGEAARGGGAGGVVRAVRPRGRGARAAALRGGRAGARAPRRAAGGRAAAARRLGRRGGAPAGGRARGVRDSRRRQLPAAPGRAAAAPTARRRQRAARLYEDARLRREGTTSRRLLKTWKFPSMRFSDGCSGQNQKYLRTAAAALRETCLPRKNEPYKWSLTLCLKGWLENGAPIAPHDVF